MNFANSGCVPMCRSVEEMVKEAEADGVIRGVIQVGKLKNLSTEQIVESLIAVCHITGEEAEKLVRERG